MAKKRVFILGAGFSVQAGLPLANELMPLLIEKAGLKDDAKEFQEWRKDFEQRLRNAEGFKDADGINFEHWFDVAWFDIELWRMRQHLAPVRQGDGPGTPHRRAEDISTWLGYIEEAIPHVFWDKQKGADLDSIKRFTECLTDDDTVVTFNYDTLVERALSKQTKPWNHGFKLETTGGVSVLKMHGSIDWLLLKRREETELRKFVKLFSKTIKNAPAGNGAASDGKGGQTGEREYDLELWRAKEEAACEAMLDMDEKGLSSFHYELGLAGLGRYKPLHRLVGSGETWVKAFRALKEAEEVYAVGFYMSYYDTMTRFHFAGAMRGGEKKPSKGVIVDPRAAGLRDAYRNVFGVEPVFEEDRAEDVNWRKLLSQ